MVQTQVPETYEILDGLLGAVTYTQPKGAIDGEYTGQSQGGLGGEGGEGGGEQTITPQVVGQQHCDSIVGVDVYAQPLLGAGHAKTIGLYDDTIVQSQAVLAQDA